MFAVARLGFVDLVNSDNSEIGEFRNSRNSQCVLYRHRQCALIPKIQKMHHLPNFRNSENSKVMLVTPPTFTERLHILGIWRVWQSVDS